MTKLKSFLSNHFQDIKKNWKFIIASILFFSLIILIILEVFSILFIKRLGWNYEPAYLRLIKGYTSANLVGGRTEYHSWGSWNVSNYEGRIANNCFDVKYKFNSYGARDKERSEKGKNRTIVFGDSFTEGWGVDQDKIVAAELERLSGKEFLNFGIAGNGSGGLNQFILYRDFARKFEHDTVMIGHYLGNDFRDNDPVAWQGLAKIYYRPFWELTEDKKDIKIMYYAKQEKGKYLLGLEPENKKEHFATFTKWSEFSALLNLLTVLQNYKISLNSNRQMSESAYDLNVSDDAITANLIVYDKFSKLIGDKNKYIYLIPAATDVFYYRNHGKKKVPKLESYKKQLSNQGWKVIDLIDVFADLPEKEIPNYFICDGHWNANGNKLVADYLYKILNQ